MVVDKNGIPLSVIVKEGNIHDIQFADKHLKDLNFISIKYNIRNKYLLADKAYESKNLREMYVKHNYTVLIPKKKNANNNHYFDKKIYKNRHIIKNTFAKLKILRRIMIRYDAKIKSYMSFLYLGIAEMIYDNID